VHVFSVVEDGAELEKGVRPPRRGRIRNPGREDSIADPFGDRSPLRAVGPMIAGESYSQARR